MKKTMDSHVIPAKAPRRKHSWGAGIQSRTAGPALPEVGFRVKPGMMESDRSFWFMLTDY